MIETIGLRRTYQSTHGLIRRTVREIEAVKGLDLRIDSQQIFGLLGPNGAGKTTTIKMLNTLLLPTAGTARVCGFDVVSQTREVRRRIGYVFGGDKGFYDRLTARENLRYFADLFGVEPRRQRTKVAEVLDVVGLTGRENEKTQGYSRGMRQRLHIARGLLTEPKVLLLDEPTIGVDPVAARDLRATIADLPARGTTVLLTTHYMAEAEELCNRLAIITDGQIAISGTAEDLKRYTSGRLVTEFEVYGIGSDQVRQVEALGEVDTVSLDIRGMTQILTVHSDLATDPQTAVLDVLRSQRIGRVASRAPSLEDAYVAIVSGAAKVGSGA